jgi:hypothetical protein
MNLVGLFLLLVSPSVYGETLDVCQLLANLSSLKGQRVSIRGIWSIGDASRVLLPEHPCEHAAVFDGWIWPDRINLVPELGAIVSQHLGSRSNLLKRHPDSVVLATLIGVIETKDTFVISTFPNGTQEPRGFERLVAQLRFTDAKDMVVVPRSAVFSDGRDRRRMESPIRAIQP